MVKNNSSKSHKSGSPGIAIRRMKQSGTFRTVNTDRKLPRGDDFITVRRAEYDGLVEKAILAINAGLVDDAQDLRDAKIQLNGLTDGSIKLIPNEVAKMIAVEGLHPVLAFRSFRGWTAQQLADKSGIGRTTITQMETGERTGTIDAYKALAKAFETSVDALLI